MIKIAFITSGSGSILDHCFKINSFKDTIHSIVLDRKCGAIEVAKKHKKIFFLIEESSSVDYSRKLLNYLDSEQIDYAISYSNLKILKGAILNEYHNRIFNSHFSILPAFKGFYHKGESQNDIPAMRIFERTLDYRSLICGNTIHVIEKKIDNGQPVLVGIICIPYNQSEKLTRQKLFEIECKTLMQFTIWLFQNRLKTQNEIYIKDVKFNNLNFSPNLEDNDIINFNL